MRSPHARAGEGQLGQRPREVPVDNVCEVKCAAAVGRQVSGKWSVVGGRSECEYLRLPCRPNLYVRYTSLVSVVCVLNNAKLLLIYSVY